MSTFGSSLLNPTSPMDLSQPRRFLISRRFLAQPAAASTRQRILGNRSPAISSGWRQIVCCTSAIRKRTKSGSEFVGSFLHSFKVDQAQSCKPFRSGVYNVTTPIAVLDNSPDASRGFALPWRFELASREVVESSDVHDQADTVNGNNRSADRREFANAMTRRG